MYLICTSEHDKFALSLNDMNEAQLKTLAHLPKKRVPELIELRSKTPFQRLTFKSFWTGSRLLNFNGHTINAHFITNMLNVFIDIAHNR